MARLYKIGPNSQQGFIRLLQPASRITPSSTLINVVTGGPPPPLGEFEKESPTGYRPKLIWTPNRQWIMENKALNNHWTWSRLLTLANQASPPDGDFGQFSAIVYQVTGDISHAIKAWPKLLAQLNVANSSGVPGSGINGNNSREFHRFLVYLEILRPYIIQDQAKIDAIWVATARWHNWINVTYGTNTADSDVANGHYWYYAILDRLDFPDNPYFGQLLNSTNVRNLLPIGGLSPSAGWSGTSATARATLRDTIEDYFADEGVGGMFIESSDYNESTLRGAFMGMAASETLGSGNFQSIKQFINDLCLLRPYMFSQNMARCQNWSDMDDGSNHSIVPYKTFNSSTIAQSLALNSTSRKSMQKFLAEFEAEHSASLSTNALRICDSFLFWDPYEAAQSADWDFNSTFSTKYATGMGHLYGRSSDVNVRFLSNRPPGVHHALTTFDDFTIIRGKNSYTQDHPFGYGSGPVQARYHNTSIFAGIQSLYIKADPRVETGSGWMAITTSHTGGAYSPTGTTADNNIYYNPPPNFATKWKTTNVYIKIGNVNYIVSKTWMSGVNPQTLPNFARYNAGDQARINTFMSETPGCTKRIQRHCHGTPVQLATRTTWLSAASYGGVASGIAYDVGIEHLYPTTFARLVQPGTVLPNSSPPSSVHIKPSEDIGSKNVIGIYNSVDQVDDIFINVNFDKPVGSAWDIPTLSDVNTVVIGVKTIVITETAVTVTG